MKTFFTLFVLLFSTSVLADDISDFQIEGMSVGDSLLDFKVSQHLGIDCVLVHNGHNDINRLHNTGTNTFSNIKDLYNWVINT